MKAIVKNPEILIRVLETVKSYLASSEESLSASLNPLDVIAVLDNLASLASAMVNGENVEKAQWFGRTP